MIGYSKKVKTLNQKANAQRLISIYSTSPKNTHKRPYKVGGRNGQMSYKEKIDSMQKQIVEVQVKILDEHGLNMNMNIKELESLNDSQNS